MNNQKYIDAYFENTLTDDEKIIFQNLLNEDQDFTTAFNYENNLKKAITLNERAILKQKLQSFENQKDSYKPFKKWYLVASIALFVFFGLWFVNKETNSEILYDSYYSSYPNVVAPTVRGKNSHDLKTNAFFEYDNGNYKNALTLFSTIYTSDKSDYALFYKALSLLELNKPKEAIATFELFDINDNNAFTPYVKWYKALAYLKTNQNAEAKRLILSLAETDNPQQEMAKKLVVDMD